MARTSLADYPCSIARTLDAIGDQWSFLIIRDALLGRETFTDFQKSLRVSKNILSQRLGSLVEQGSLSKEPQSPNGRRNRYRLTDRGMALFPIVVAMLQWGDKWCFGSLGEPIKVLDAKTKAPVQNVVVVSRDGQCLQAHDVIYERSADAREQNS